MNIEKYNGVVFRGQFADAFKILMEGNTVDINTFHNGSYECTTKIKRFLELINMARIEVDINKNERGSLRSYKIKLKE